jgi:ATP-dependent Clp protease ATP-binding subunit ClpC
MRNVRTEETDMSSSPGVATLTLDRYDVAAKNWVGWAQQRADVLHHVEVTPLHLLLSGLESELGIEEVFQQARVDVGELRSLVNKAVARLPVGKEPAFLSVAFLGLMRRAERSAVENQRTVQVADLLDALTQSASGDVASILTSVGVVAGGLRPSMGALRRPAAEPPKPASKAGVQEGLVEDWVAAAQRERAPIVGRSDEIRRVLTVLERREKSHPVLVGEPGVGKAAILRGLAREVADGAVPPALSKVRLLDVDMGALAAGVRLKGEVVERLRALAAEYPPYGSEPNILIFRDLGRILGGSPVQPNAADLLSSLLSRAQIRLVATVTPREWQRITREHSVLLEWLTPIAVDAPSPDEAIAMVKGAMQRYEKHHTVSISESAVTASVHLARRYLSERHLPDSAFDLLDEAAASLRVQLGASNAEDTEAALDEGHVAATVATWTGIPVAKMLEAETDKLLRMEERLSSRVIGQDEAASALAKAVRRSRVGLRDPRRPIGSFLFLGTSGVGKTEMAKALAEFLFDDPAALTRLDMSEFMERHMAQRLVGAPPGYADSEQGGFLTEAVRRRPYSVLLFDEVEKAHADVFNLLLSVLDDGRLTDGRGQTADFTNTVVIMTSNIGAERLIAADPAMFESGEGQDRLEAELMTSLRAFFRPEFLNRISEIVAFRPLAKPDLIKIVDLQLGQVSSLLEKRGLSLSVSPAAKAALVDLSYEPALGARPLQRAIVKFIQDPLAADLLRDARQSGSSVHVDWDGSAFVFA